MRWLPLEQRFWTKVDRSDPDACWDWGGGRNVNGYGQVYDGQRQTNAHRVAWTLTHGSIPDAMFVCHRCDNPACVNPAHLFLGTPKDNTQDMLRKGRCRPGRGTLEELRGGSKLTESSAAEIRESDEPGHVLAKRYGVSEAAISMCRRRITWWPPVVEEKTGA